MNNDQFQHTFSLRLIVTEANSLAWDAATAAAVCFTLARVLTCSDSRDSIRACGRILVWCFHNRVNDEYVNLWRDWTRCWWNTQFLIKIRYPAYWCVLDMIKRGKGLQWRRTWYSAAAASRSAIVRDCSAAVALSAVIYKVRWFTLNSLI